MLLIVKAHAGYDCSWGNGGRYAPFWQESINPHGGMIYQVNKHDEGNHFKWQGVPDGPGSLLDDPNLAFDSWDMFVGGG